MGQYFVTTALPLLQMHRDQSLLAENFDSKLHILCSWCSTDQDKIYFEATSWFKEENNFGKTSGLIRDVHSGNEVK